MGNKKALKIHGDNIEPKHVQQFPLGRDEFMYKRRGPWPQPAPDHPMFMAAEVLHPAKAEKWDWTWTAGINYLKALITKLPLACRNWFLNSRLDHISDEKFTAMLTENTYSKYMRRRTADYFTGSNFVERLGPLDPNKQYFSVDFSPVQDIDTYPGIYVAPTITLFERSGERDTAVALAISIGNLVDKKWQHTVITPEDKNAWRLSKYFALQGGAHVVTLSGHPATHFPYDTVNAVTQSSVPMRHTIFKLLKPHLRLQLAVNNAVLEGGHSVVSESHGEFYAPYSGTGTEVRQLVAAGFIGYPHLLSKYEPSDTPTDAYPRWKYPMGPRDIPSDFGRVLSAYYTTTQNFVRKVVAEITAMEESDQGQEEIYYIKEWAHNIARWLPGFPDRDEIMELDDKGDPKLVCALTTFIWDVSVAHTLDHHAFGSLGPHLTPFRIRVPPPSSMEAAPHTRQKILSGWDMFKSTLAFEMFFKPHNVQLLKDITYNFDNDTLREAEKTFMTDLKKTNQALIDDGIDVELYAPLDQIACSIQY